MPAAVAYIPPPSARDLLPPLLACLSTASASKQPPPALLPLLSPILRQRVQLLASDNWLSLLSWDNQVASRLPPIISAIHVEPHPASGEIEADEPDRILYRRSDPETLHSRLVLGEFGLIPTYLYCTGGEGGNGWRLAELRGTQDEDDGTQWFTSIQEANEAGLRRTSRSTNGASNHTSVAAVPQPDTAQQDEEDDDSYWAAYDRTPGRTPQKRSPAPPANSRVQVGPTQSELEYFARYAMEVQPALDAHDPDEDGPAAGESTLNGNSLNLQRDSSHSSEPHSGYSHTNGNGRIHEERKDSMGEDDSTKAEHIESIDVDHYATINHPRPSSAASSNSVERLEREAESHSQAELAIKQHISTDLKSLFRLARTAGIERQEFERIVQRELEVLPLLEQDN